MNIAKWLRFESLENTVKRFPLPVFCSLVCFVISALAIFRFINDGFDVLGRLFLSFVLSFVFLTSTQLILERSKFNKNIFFIVSVLITAVLSFIVVWSSDDFALNLFTTVGSLALFIGVSPYIFNARDDLSFWSFNKKIWFGVAVSFIAALLLWGGASAAIVSIDYLFGVDMPDEFYAVIAAFCFSVLGPVYALSFVPNNFVEIDQECSMPPQLNFITNWILAPLVAVYFVILYAYYMKIGVTFSVPKGELAYITSGFAIAGIITYLVSWPSRLTSGKILSFVSKYIFPALILPTVMLLVAILMRVEQYGITEKRYIVLVFGLWFGFLAVGFTLKKLQLKHVVVSFSVLLFLSSWGPWGMKQVSLNSQSSRLEKMLVDNGLLRDGVIKKVEHEKNISFEARKNISSVISYLSNYRRSAAEKDKYLYGYKNQQKLHDALGFSHVSRYDQNRVARDIKSGKFNFVFRRNSMGGLVEVKKYDLYVHNISSWKNSDKRTLRAGDAVIEVDLKDNQFVLSNKKGQTIPIDLTDIVLDQLKNNPDREPAQRPLVIKRSAHNMRIEVSIMNLSGEIKDGAPVVNSINASALITLQ